MIVYTQSKGKSWERCPRLRWWEYECPSGDGTRGWEPRKLNLPLSTGGACHEIAEGLLQGMNAAERIAAVREGYLLAVRSRGIELGLSLDGAIPEERFLERTIAEQAALIEAFGWAFNRVRLPRLLEEYGLLDVEREETTPLAGDVLLQSRCDAVLRRKSDGLVFVYNLKTAKDPFRKSWQDQWLYDQQMMTEVLAVERRLGERVYGVVVDGFDKGERVTCWWHNLKELREGMSKPPAEGDEKWQRQRSRLLYGYKCELPGKPALYDWNGTGKGNAKGWDLVAIYQNDFAQGLDFRSAMEEVKAVSMSPIEYWINWLPQEVVESCFAVLPPIVRLDEHVDARVRQIVRREQEIRTKRDDVDSWAHHPAYETQTALDWAFPQSSGYQCQWCDFRRVCWEGVRPEETPELFQSRTANHPTDVEE